VDALASLRPCAVDVTVGEWVYTIPELPAAAWLEAVLAETGGSIFPGLCDVVTRADVWREIVHGRATPDEIAECERHALEAAAGQRWWKVDRLVRSATLPEYWPLIHGDLIRHGLDPERISIGAFYNAVYALVVSRMNEESQKNKLDFDLDTPPPGVDAEEAFADAGDDFMAALQADRRLHSGDLPIG
jgi:hypothetical protein